MYGRWLWNRRYPSRSGREILRTLCAPLNFFAVRSSRRQSALISLKMSGLTSAATTFMGGEDPAVDLCLADAWRGEQPADSFSTRRGSVRPAIFVAV